MKTDDKNSILIVDDEKANIIALTYILSQEYTIYAAKNGRDAIETAKEHAPDLILLDIIMPGIDGYELLSQLKNTLETKATPVIFITGLAETEAEEKGMALGASDYITKPFSQDIVRLRVRNQMQILNQIRIINTRLKQQTLLASISQGFLYSPNIAKMLSDTLRKVGEFMGIDQVLLYDLEEEDAVIVCRHEWINPAFTFPGRVGSRHALNEQMLLVIRHAVADDTALCLHSNDPVFKSLMGSYMTDFENFIAVPVFVKGKVCAFLDFSREDARQLWSESDLNLAVLVGYILSGVYERTAMERQSSIVENSPHFTMYLSPDGEVSYVNPAALKLTGQTMAEIAEKGLDLIFDSETVRKIKALYIPDTMKNGSDRFEVKITCKDGKIRILAFTSFTAENGNIGAIAQDVTEMRVLENALIEAKEQAEKSSRAKSEFLSRMSHEMHTPMNAIIGMTQIAWMNNDPEKRDECFDEIDSASRHLLRLIDDVLDVSSMEEDTLKLDASGFSFNAMLDNVLKMIKPHTEEKHQSLSFKIDPLVPEVIVSDERRLAQIFQNLLMNATKFTPDGGALGMNVSVLEMGGEELMLQSEISDNGIGIPSDKQEIIFDSFEQVDGGSSRGFDGAGLGLAIAKHIVELMGGRIWVESEPGKGSKFIFTVRIKNPEGCAPQKDNSCINERIFEGKAALLAEDVEVNREIVIAMLGNTGIEIDCAENGSRAVEIFSANPGKYDIILMDVNMPELDGMEAARRIRMSGAAEKVKIIALTANTHRDEIEKCFSAGMDDHIGKPIDMHKLYYKLNKYLK